MNAGGIAVKNRLFPVKAVDVNGAADMRILGVAFADP